MGKGKNKFLKNRKCAVLCCTFFIAAAVVVSGRIAWTWLWGSRGASDSDANKYSNYKPQNTEPVIHTIESEDADEYEEIFCTSLELTDEGTSREYDCSSENSEPGQDKSGENEKDDVGGTNNEKDGNANQQLTINVENSNMLDKSTESDFLKDNTEKDNAEEGSIRENCETDSGKDDAEENPEQYGTERNNPGQNESEDTSGQNLSATDLPVLNENATMEDLMETVADTTQVLEKNGHVYLNYAQPQVPSEYHLTVKAEVYDKNGKTLCRYVSDAGWLSQPENYDASAKEVMAKLDIANLQDKELMIVIRVSDSDVSKSASVWMLQQDASGNKTVTTAVLN